MEKAKTKQQKPEASAGSLGTEPHGDGVSARVGAVGRPLGVLFFFSFLFFFCLFCFLCCFRKLCLAFHLVLKQTNKAPLHNLPLSRTEEKGVLLEQ